ncbi:hypothetical protein HZZ00_37420 (plasmid) [Streptomyces sp. NEAU-sy36]|uniref:hypothetical protein n=1 Tax=unclassified Streptomyces TaxID=2593676 RepID=UPI0015D644E9|nr:MULTISPECIES: hypothetical protein [unclassified Streptomyces]QLJ06714.1 hypothetical protein HZZ00_37420 [Streptomyces sp. NEAU-sy36]
MTEQQTNTAETILERLARQQRESLERRSQVEKAWSSPEAKRVHEFIKRDGNVDWREFVSHCGGIMNVVALLDAQGQPDADRIIPLVDELFDKYAVTEYRGGITMTRRPNNRPYRPQRGPSVEEQRAQFPGDGGPAEEPPAYRPVTAPR